MIYDLDSRIVFEINHGHNNHGGIYVKIFLLVCSLFIIQ